VGEQDDITDRIAWPCPYCGAASIRLIACPAPTPMAVSGRGCLFSEHRNGPVVWRYCDTEDWIVET
jgi:hypothetical protein